VGMCVVCPLHSVGTKTIQITKLRWSLLYRDLPLSPPAWPGPFSIFAPLSLAHSPFDPGRSHSPAMARTRVDYAFYGLLLLVVSALAAVGDAQSVDLGSWNLPASFSLSSLHVRVRTRPLPIHPLPK
jgi:hypothetical protein